MRMADAGLTREQRQAVRLLSFGTFLEYFDLWLYAHMAVLLNELFFPKTDPTVAQLLGATAFCLTYVLRPVGDFLIGKIGDAKSRKFTIMITTFVMAIACLIMVSTPEYEKIGITATIMVIVARVLQCFSSLGKVMGAQLYLSEIIKMPYKCVATGMTGVATQTGGFLALATASFVLSMGMNWRWAFGVGAGIVLIGFGARVKLRETHDFIDYKRRIAKRMEKNKQDLSIIKNISIDNEKVNKKTILAFAFTEFHSPICFYITYIYLGDFMKKFFNMTTEEVIYQNLKVGMFAVIGALTVVYLVKKTHPVKVAIVTALFFVILLPFIPYWINNISNLFSLFCLQCIIFSLTISTCGTLDSISYKYFSISKRFTSIATTFGIASALSLAITSFSLIPLTHYFCYYGLWFIFTPAVIGYLWALYYFRKLEIERGLYFDYPCEEKSPYPDTAIKKGDCDYSLSDEYEPFKGKCEFSTTLLNEIENLNQKADEKINIKLVEKAIVFAKRWHGNQLRKTGTEPFYSHPMAVAQIVSKYYFKTDVIIACILHDTVEDCEDCTLN